MRDEYSWSCHGSLTSHHTIQITRTLEAAGISGESAITNDRYRKMGEIWLDLVYIISIDFSTMWLFVGATVDCNHATVGSAVEDKLVLCIFVISSESCSDFDTKRQWYCFTNTTYDIQCSRAITHHTSSASSFHHFGRGAADIELNPSKQMSISTLDINRSLHKIIPISPIDLRDKWYWTMHIDDMTYEFGRIADISLSRHKLAKGPQLMYRISMFGKNLRNYRSVCTISNSIHGSEADFHNSKTRKVDKVSRKIGKIFRKIGKIFRDVVSLCESRVDGTWN